MARPLGLEFAGALYHVTARGDRREDVDEDDEDREAFLSLFANVANRFNWLVHAYCLMTNHYHLLIETPDSNLSKGMRQLNGVYTQYSNPRTDGSGTCSTDATRRSWCRKNPICWRWRATSYATRSARRWCAARATGPGVVIERQRAGQPCRPG